MTDTTPITDMARILPRQVAHTPLTRNFNRLDSLVAIAVIDRDDNAPPGSPSDGDTYIVAGSPTGDWAGQANDIAIYGESEWLFVTPSDGMLCFVQDEDEWLAYNETETEWHPLLERWSTTEHWTGHYSGAPAATTKIYSKVVTLSTLPNVTTKNFAHSITNLDVTKRITFQAWCEDGTDLLPIPSATSAGHIGIGIDTTNVKVYSGFNASSFDGEVRLTYHKTA